MSIFFKSPDHETRLGVTMQRLGKIERGKLDPEYAAALYILCADLATWNKSQEYVTRHGIDIETLLEDIDFSGGYSVLIKLAGNLFNSQVHIDPIELLRLDENNFLVALTAIKVRRYSIIVVSSDTQNVLVYGQEGVE